MSLAETELMLGQTMLGARLKDARTIFRYLLSRPDFDHTRVAVWGDSFAQSNAEDFTFDQSEMQAAGPFAQHQAEPMGALLALLTGLYEDRVTAIAARGGLISFLAVLEDRFCHVPQDVIVPRVLEAGDTADIVAAQGSRPVLLERFVDGRNRAANDARLHAEFQTALKVSGRLVVREAPGEPGLASWLSEQCLRQAP
jgi:hypothetical protein